MTTREAFDKLLGSRGSASQLSAHSGTFKKYRSMIKEKKKYPSEDKMMEYLMEAGYKMVQERKWEVRK